MADLIGSPSAHDHRDHQADHFDHLGSPEFEIHRPHRQSFFYRYLMAFKFRRAASLLCFSLEDQTVLAICCGSGMDAEMLARCSSAVVGLDISAGAIDRAAIRARTYGVHYTLVRADAEQLPFASGSFDVAWVHDGLHHLDAPERALAEMARVSRRAVVITEPADAWLTRALIAIRVLPARESSGNLVYRFSEKELQLLFGQLGFQLFRSDRYLVRYGHPPGRWLALLSLPVIYPVAKVLFEHVVVPLTGKIGNKISAVGIRSADHR